MSRSALAEKQQPRWAGWAIVPVGPSQERPSPSDVLEQAGHYLKFFTASILSRTQTHKRRLFYRLDHPSAELQGSTEFEFRWQHTTPMRHLYDIGGPQSVKISGGTTSGRHDLGEFQINWEHVQPIQATVGPTGSRYVVISEGPSSFTVEPSEVSSPVQPSTPADILQKRYKELNSTDYLGRLTPEDEVELEKIEQQLDELDAHDPDLKSFTTQINEGYDKLRRGLTEVNRILDELLSD